MKKIWDSWLKDILLLYCGLYTLATIVNSISYLTRDVYEDPAGNWHELDRAVIVLIVTVAYALIRYLKLNNFFLKSAIIYVPTMGLAFLYVWLRGFTDELASSAYRDIFVNYTVGFVIAAFIAFVINCVRKKRAKNKS